MVEIIYVVTSVLLWVKPPNNLDYISGLILLVFFGVVVVIDIEHRLILHPVSIAGSILSLGIGWSLHGWQSTLIGGITGFAIMYGLHLLGDRFARWLARRRGEILTEVALGFGDVNLSGILGLLLGWPGVIGGLLVAFILGGIFSLVYLMWMVVTKRYKTFAAMPYGPFLVGSGVLLLYFL